MCQKFDKNISKAEFVEPPKKIPSFSGVLWSLRLYFFKKGPFLFDTLKKLCKSNFSTSRTIPQCYYNLFFIHPH